MKMTNTRRLCVCVCVGGKVGVIITIFKGRDGTAADGQFPNKGSSGSPTTTTHYIIHARITPPSSNHYTYQSTPTTVAARDLILFIYFFVFDTNPTRARCAISLLNGAILNNINNFFFFTHA